MAGHGSHTTMPPDRGGISTELRNAASVALDTLDVTACVDLMIEDSSEVTRALREGRTALATFIKAAVPRVRDGGRLIYIGAGTSGRLGVLDASECPPTFQSDPGQIVGVIAGGDSALRNSSEGLEDNPGGGVDAMRALGVSAADVVLGIAAGGTTPYVHGALREAGHVGAVTGLLTCAVPGEVMCEHLIMLPTGPEILTGSTRLKAGTVTKIALNTITTTLFTQLGKVHENLMVDLRASNDKLRDRAARVLMTLCPEIDRNAAFHRLAAADNNLKTAIIMTRAAVDRHEAERRLASGATLRALLES